MCGLVWLGQRCDGRVCQRYGQGVPRLRERASWLYHVEIAAGGCSPISMLWADN